MAGFKKAKAEQAALKIGCYGPAGSGKTFSALMVAEGLANATKKRIAYIDTERGTDFYAMDVPDRRTHPKAFDFDALYTRSLTEVNRELVALSPDTHSVVVLDSITHLWEAAIAAYSGPKNRAGQIPMHAWGGIKKPYKQLMQWVINSPFHVLILGRQANEWSADDNTGEMVAAGVKMKAEGETAYEPHILLRFEAVKPKRQDGKSVMKNAVAVPTVFVEKDRSGVLQGDLIEWPTYEKLAAPILKLLGGHQAKVESEDEAAAKDAQTLGELEREKAANSARLAEVWIAKFKLCESKAAAEALKKKEFTPDVRKQLRNSDLQLIAQVFEDVCAGRPVSVSAPTDPDDDQ